MSWEIIVLDKMVKRILVREVSCVLLCSRKDGSVSNLFGLGSRTCSLFLSYFSCSSKL